MFEIYSFCRLVDDVADSSAPHAERRQGLAQWREDIDAIYAGRPRVELTGARARREKVRSAQGRLHGRDRRHGHGRGGRHPRAGMGQARPLLRPRGERGRPAFGARVRHERAGRHYACASSRPGAAAHQHPARYRRGRRPRQALSAARGIAPTPASPATDPGRCWPTRRLPQACDAVAERARRAISRRRTRIMARSPRRAVQGAAHHGGASIAPCSRA